MTTLDYATFYETQVRPRQDARRLALRAALVTLMVFSPTLILLLR